MHPDGEFYKSFHVLVKHVLDWDLFNDCKVEYDKANAESLVQQAHELEVLDQPGFVECEDQRFLAHSTFLLGVH